uniref:Uncharacterized protein n=1 Tax=Physcomitrium patens TaxID=3218 RepID=A0A2K1J1I4_PHYPA|nr:hypothetical protein PHYPA_023276 [Physcomitrium patens]
MLIYINDVISKKNLLVTYLIRLRCGLHQSPPKLHKTPAPHILKTSHNRHPIKTATPSSKNHAPTSIPEEHYINATHRS